MRANKSSTPAGMVPAVPRAEVEAGATARAPQCPSAGGEPTHTICGYCNEVLTGDPMTVAKPGALVSTDCCLTCKANQIAADYTPAQQVAQIAQALKEVHALAYTQLRGVIEKQRAAGWPDLTPVDDAFHPALNDTQSFASSLADLKIALAVAKIDQRHAPKRIQSHLP